MASLLQGRFTAFAARVSLCVEVESRPLCARFRRAALCPPCLAPSPEGGPVPLSVAAAERLPQLFRRECGSERLCAQPCPAPAMFFTGCWVLGSREDSVQGSFLGWAGPLQTSVALLAFRGGGSGCSEQPWERVLPSFQQLLWRQPHI